MASLQQLLVAMLYLVMIFVTSVVASGNIFELQNKRRQAMDGFIAHARDEVYARATHTTFVTEMETVTWCHPESSIPGCPQATTVPITVITPGTMTTSIVITIGPIIDDSTSTTSSNEASSAESTPSVEGCSDPGCSESTSTVTIPCTTDVTTPIVRTESTSSAQAPCTSSNSTVSVQGPGTGIGIGSHIFTITCPGSPQCVPAPLSAPIVTVTCPGSPECISTAINTPSTLSATSTPVAHWTPPSGTVTVVVSVSTSRIPSSTSTVTDSASPSMTLIPSLAVIENCKFSTMFGALLLVFLLTIVL